MEQNLRFKPLSAWEPLSFQNKFSRDFRKLFMTALSLKWNDAGLFSPVKRRFSFEAKISEIRISKI